MLILIALMVWSIAGLVTVKIADRAGYTWGWFDGDGWSCRAWVILQAPGALLDTLLKDLTWCLLYGEEPLTPAHAYILWSLFLDPRLDPDAALKRFDEKP